MKMQTYEEWLEANPPPDMQALCRQYGGWRRVPLAVVNEFDRELTAWEWKRKFRHSDFE